MRRYAMILYNKAHWIFEQDTTPDFPPDPQGNPMVVVDITDKPDVCEGWDFDPATGAFSEPIIPLPEFDYYAILDTYDGHVRNLRNSTLTSN
ncbi:MAG: hypothetical protein FWD96_04345, partial [Defluviitaleaceae bacterium]|nr:hypothetical protein [Defluviitaleaceae bacterium]